MYKNIILFMLIIYINYILFNVLHIAKDRAIFLLEQELSINQFKEVYTFDM